jgi:hypothetical protein
MKISSFRRSLDRATKETQGVPDAERLNQLWEPQTGPQTEAFLSPADELLFGGAAGF